MRSSSRVLIIIGAVVAVLAILAVAVGLMAGDRTRLLPEDSPEGAVQRFLLAVQASDYTKAYGYLGSRLKARCAFDYFLEQRPRGKIEEIQANIMGTNSFDGRVEVKILVTRFRTEGGFVPPFESPASSYPETFVLAQEEGRWLFTQPPWPVYWCPSPEPIRPAPAPPPAPSN